MILQNYPKTTTISYEIFSKDYRMLSQSFPVHFSILNLDYKNVMIIKNSHCYLFQIYFPKFMDVIKINLIFLVCVQNLSVNLSVSVKTSVI